MYVENNNDINKLEKRYKKKFFFVFCAISTVAITLFLISMQLMFFQAQQFTAEIAKSTKKRDLVSTVNNTIISIENKQKRLIAQKKEALSFIKIDMIHDEMHHKNFIDRLKTKLQHFHTYDGVNVLIFSGSDIIYSNKISKELNRSQLINNIEHNAVAYKLFSIQKYSVIVWISHQYIKDEVVRYLKQTIYTMEYPENQYLWVNEIVNYNGGSQYAIRKIHPNLKHTEGQFISTTMPDIKGNLPYKMELDGVTKNGEVASEYYFKNLNNNKIEKKITYAKLYKDYNWVVATGVPISEITNYITSLKEESKSIIFLFYAFNIICCITLIYLSFRTIKRISNEYRKKINEFVEHETQNDMLTGCYNRKSGDRLLNKSFSNFKNNNAESAILLIDIDNFKNVNDTYGHDVGDEVLIKTVDAIDATINHSEKNKLIRWGGEEFIVILGDSNSEESKKIIEEILSNVSDILFFSEKKKFTITISIGISIYDEEDASYQTSLKRADLALYYVKNHGKNHYKFYEPCHDIKDI